MKNAIGALLIVLVTACAQADSAGTSPAPDPGGGSAAADDRCTTDYVEVTNGNPACGMALEEDGSLTVGEQKTPPIVVSHQEGADGKTDITAKKLVLFPPSTLRGYRIVQACEDTIETSLCWAVRLLTVDGTLLAVSAGKYGPERWIRWSPEEKHVALISNTEGFDWLHVIDTATGATTTYPDEPENANWTIDRATFTWQNDRTFVLDVNSCKSCAPEARSFTVP
jgi:hypothetical protein